MNQNLEYSEPSDPGDSSDVSEGIFFSKISEVINTCELSKNLMINIYLAQENRFIYCNKVFERCIGYGTQKIANKGWDFWYSIVVPLERALVKSKVEDFFAKPLNDTLVLRYHIMNASGEKICIRHEIFIYIINEQGFVLSYFFDISEKEQIEHCLKVNGGYRKNSAYKNPCAKISSREGEVLKLIANGFSSKQIADKLFISNHTAISHRKHLIEKFRVKNTAQLIKEASKILEL